MYLQVRTFCEARFHCRMPNQISTNCRLLFDALTLSETDWAVAAIAKWQPQINVDPQLLAAQDLWRRRR